MEDLIGKIPGQIREAAKLGDINIKGKVDNIVVCGMGASGICGDITRDLVKDKVVIVNKDYNLPSYVNKRTLVFIVSYSGNTEETISSYNQAKKRTKNVVVVTSGGKLSKENNIVKIPRGLPPRYAVHYLFFPILKVLEKLKLVSAQHKSVEESIKVMNSIKKEQAKKIADSLKGKIPIVAVPERYKSIGLRWVQQFNENSKVQAILQTFPDLDHNTIEGYANPKEKFEMIVIRHKKEGKRERTRIELTEKILSRKISIAEVWMRGESDLAKLFYTIHLGDYITYYLGLIDKVNPYENKVITLLKKQIKEHVG